MKPALALALALSACQPAYAATYGPPAPTVEAPRSITERQSFEIGPQETLEAAEARHRRVTTSAWRTFWIGQGLAAADIALTCVALSQRNADGSRRFREANPLYGKGATCGRVAAIRGGVSVLQYVLARRSIERDPAKARKGLRIMVAVQGLPVLWNAVQLAK